MPHRIIAFLIIMFGLRGCPMPTTGTQSPGTMISDPKGVGVSWTNLDNAKASDDVYALADTSLVFGTEWLVATNFNFMIPERGRIVGLVATVEIKSNRDGLVFENVVLVIGGVPNLTTDIVDGETTSTTEAIVTFGSSTNLWNVALTKSIVEAADFGLAISFPDTTGSGPDFAYSQFVDHMTIEVFYQIPGAADIFTAGAVASESYRAGDIEQEIYTASSQAEEFYVAAMVEGDRFVPGCVSGDYYSAGAEAVQFYIASVKAGMMASE